jgi:hypothetical protein
MLRRLQVVEVATDATTTEAPAALRELTKDDFYEFLGEAQTLVVVDFFTGAHLTPDNRCADISTSFWQHCTMLSAADPALILRSVAPLQPDKHQIHTRSPPSTHSSMHLTTLGPTSLHLITISSLHPPAPRLLPPSPPDTLLSLPPQTGAAPAR